MSSLQYRLLAIASFIAAITIIIGALGAHFLKSILDATELNSIETAVRYQMYHAFAIMFLVLLATKAKPSTINTLLYVFIVGIICFSGSIYVFTLLSILNINVPSFVRLITPIGGLLLVTGWGILCSNSIKHLYQRNKERNS